MLKPFNDGSVFTHHGQWTQENGEYRFTGTQIRVLKCHIHLHLSNLSKELHKSFLLTFLNLLKHKVQVQNIVRAFATNGIFEWFWCRFFFLKEASNGFRNPLCITYEHKLNIVEPNGHLKRIVHSQQTFSGRRVIIIQSLVYQPFNMKLKKLT